MKTGRKRKESSQRFGSKFFYRKAKLIGQSDLPQTITLRFFRLETCNCGTGRLLTAHLPVQVLHELPQDVQRWTNATRPRFRINTTTLWWTNTDVNAELKSDYNDDMIQNQYNNTQIDQEMAQLTADATTSTPVHERRGCHAQNHDR